MSYFNLNRKHNRNRFTTRPLVAASLVVVGIVVVWGIVRHVVRGVHRIPAVPSVAQMVLSKKALVNKIDELQSTIDQYNAELVTAKLQSTENVALKAELGRSASTSRILAHVITPPNRSFYDTMTIDAGTDDGVNVGEVAYGFGSIALGTVSSVAPMHATVQLFSAPGRTTSGTTQGSNVAVTLIGRGGGEYEVRMPRDVQFSVGDLIAYQSVDTAVLAQIERIVTDPRDPFQRLIAKAPVNLQALKWVIVR